MLYFFAQKGYMATLMSDIAKQLGITKSALYKHYASKQAIFDSIIERMNQLDEERAVEYEMPEGTIDQMTGKEEEEIFDQQFPKKEKLKLPGQLV